MFYKENKYTDMWITGRYSNHLLISLIIQRRILSSLERKPEMTCPVDVPVILGRKILGW